MDGRDIRVGRPAPGGGQNGRAPRFIPGLPAGRRMAFTRTATIAASPERVFSVLSDPASAQRWMPAIQRIDSVSPGPFRLGTSWQETRKAGNRIMQFDDQRLELPTAVRARPPRGGESDEG